MNCPVCDGPAEDVTSGGSDGQTIKCPTCGPYEIVGWVMLRFEALGPEGRAKALKKAKLWAEPGTRPAITGTSF